MQNFMVTLLTCSVTMTALALFYMAVTPLLTKRYSAKGRYYAWLIVVIGLIIPFRPQFDNPFIKVATPSEATMPIIQIGNGTLITVPIVPIENAAQPSALANISIWQIAAAIWLAGMIVFIAYYAIKHYHFVKMVKRWSERETSEYTVSLVQSLKNEMGLRKQIDVYRCSSIDSPMMVGFSNARLLLPMADFAHDDLYFIIKHEFVHFKRKDLYYKALVLLATAIHWFNPIVYLIAKTIDIQCEISCDAETVRSTDADTRRQYSETIIGVVKHQSKLKTALSTNFYGGKKGMKKRIFSIMDTGKKKAGAAILCCVLILTMGTGMALAAQSLPKNEPSADIGDAQLNTTHIVEDTLRSYFDPTTGKTMYSWDSGKTWTALTDDEFAAMYPTPVIEWWTYDEYKIWMDEQVAGLQALADDGIPDYYDKNDVLRDFTQSDVDEFAANCQSILDSIKDGTKVSKTVDGLTGTMISYDPRDMVTVREGDTAIGTTFLWPLPGYSNISAAYGTSIHPVTQVAVTHDGIDIPALSGTKILAAYTGTITEMSYSEDDGNFLVIEHGGGVQTLYAHLKAFADDLANGDEVAQGDVIGYVGSTGKSTGNHLHFGLIVDGEYIDPLHDGSTANGTTYAVSDNSWTDNDAAQNYDDYKQFGITCRDNKLYYNNEPVRCFDDWYSLGEDMYAGRSFFDKDGTVDVYAERDFSQIVHNSDGSYDPSGKLVGVRASSQAEFDARDLTQYTESAAPSNTTDVNNTSAYSVPTSGEVSSVATGNTYTINASSNGETQTNNGRTIAEIFEDYAAFGVTFNTKSVNGGLGNIYYDGKLVKQFTDIAPNGGVMSCSSSDGGTISLRTVYDASGKITGVEVVGY